jgi:hypothetical protein
MKIATSVCGLLAVATFSPPLATWAQTPPQVNGFQVVDYGVYGIVVDRQIKTPWGTRNIARMPKLIEQTDSICPKRGTQFGIGYIVDGKPDQGWVRLSKRIYLVSAGPGKSAGNLTSFTEDRVVQFGKYEYDGYTAIGVPQTYGVWRFEYWRDTDIVFKKDFTLDPKICDKNV